MSMLATVAASSVAAICLAPRAPWLDAGAARSLKPSRAALYVAGSVFALWPIVVMHVPWMAAATRSSIVTGLALYGTSSCVGAMLGSRWVALPQVAFVGLSLVPGLLPLAINLFTPTHRGPLVELGFVFMWILGFFVFLVRPPQS